MLCSGSISGEVRVWSVPTSTCLGCFQAHGGATEVLAFLNEGAMLLSGGSDHMLQLWSGGLGRSVTALKYHQCDQEPPQKKPKAVNLVPAALCVAVNGDYAAVGYHGAGIKNYSLDTGDLTWASSEDDMSVLCLMWVGLDPGQAEPELLVSGGSDKRLRVWKREEGEEGKRGRLKACGTFAGQRGTILALAQNSTYLATASDDFTIALWLLSELAVGTSLEPHVLLRGHSGGVTCLAFSPDGEQLLSGGKDQALMFWDVSSSPAELSKSLLHAHRDWVTGCVWTPDCVISSSNDGRLCLWDVQAGQCLGEITWRSPLTSVCCLGQYVMAGCAEGALHVWTWESKAEICHISAHKQRIHHCSVLTNPDKNINPEEMTVVTASDDGAVQLWKPLQMEHFSTFPGHSGAICGVVRKQGLPEFLTVSEDCSVRCWTWKMKGPVCLSGSVTAVCFSQGDGVCLVGYTSGLLELWQHNTVIGHKQASGSTITAICTMPHGQFAISYMDCFIDVLKLVWNKQHGTASLLKMTTYTMTSPVVHLCYCTVLIGVSVSGVIYDVTNPDKDDWNHKVTTWEERIQILGLIHNDEKSMWLVGEGDEGFELGFIFAMGSKNSLYSAFSSMTLECEEEQKKKNKSPITAATVDRDFIVCGDMKGNMWFNQPADISSWSSRKPAHSDRISVLRLTNSTIVSASYDRTVKLWDRITKKQVGMFVCGGPVLVLEVNPDKPTELVCGDGQGKLYFLSWKE